MVEVLHKRATTTHAIRAERQPSQDLIVMRSRRYTLNPETAPKWRSGDTGKDAPMGLSNPHSTSVTPLQKAVVVAFRKKTRLPLEDCLYVPQRSIPTLPQSSLHRPYQQQGVSQLPRSNEAGREKKPFKPYPLRYVPIDISPTRTSESKVYFVVATDGTTRVVYAKLYERADQKNAFEFRQATLKALPYRVYTVLIDSDIPFTKKLRTIGCILSMCSVSSQSLRIGSPSLSISGTMVRLSA